MAEIILGNVIGPRGEKGDQGERGLQGAKGDKGDKGEKGDGTYVTVGGVAQNNVAFVSDPQTQINGKTAVLVGGVAQNNVAFVSDPQTQINKMTPKLIYDGASNDPNINLGYPNGILAGTTFQIPAAALSNVGSLIVEGQVYTHKFQTAMLLRNSTVQQEGADYYNTSWVGKGNVNIQELFGMILDCTKYLTNFKYHSYLYRTATGMWELDPDITMGGRLECIKGVMV